MKGIFRGILEIFGFGKSPQPRPAAAEVYLRLRQQVLTLEPGSIGLDSASPNPVWGVLMETGHPEAVVTLVAIADGSVSLYLSHGGGFIGMGQHEGPRTASRDLLSAAPTFLEHARQTCEFPLPEPGHTRFYFLTFDGTYTAEAGEDDLAHGQHPMSPLFAKAQDVITQMRLVDEERRRPAAGMLHAATTGDTQALRSMVESGVPVNVTDETGLTPLMAASYSGMTEAQAVLLDLGAAIEATDSSGYTALMFACNAGKTDSARLLVERGADVHHGDKESSTPIMFAAQHGHNEIVRLLLEKGADPQVKGSHGLSAIGFAQQNQLEETERLLTRKP